MIHSASKIGIREGKPTEGRIAQNFARCWLTVQAKKESGLRIKVCMSPTVQYNPRYVFLRIETRRSEHLRKLVADARFVLPERCAQHLITAANPLVIRRHSWIRIEHFQCKHDRRVRSDRRTLASGQSQLAHFHVIADSFEPAAATHSLVVKETPVADRNVHHHARRAIKLRVCLTVSLGEIIDNVLGRPTSSCHYR